MTVEVKINLSAYSEVVSGITDSTDINKNGWDYLSRGKVTERCGILWILGRQFVADEVYSDIPLGLMLYFIQLRGKHI